jgi:hypothetical protein
MNSVIISDYGVMLAKTGERLVIRGPRPRLELIEGGPRLFCAEFSDEEGTEMLQVKEITGLKPVPLAPQDCPDERGLG